MMSLAVKKWVQVAGALLVVTTGVLGAWAWRHQTDAQVLLMVCTALFALMGAGMALVGVVMHPLAQKVHQARDDLLRSSTRWSLVIKYAGDGICALDVQGRITLWNPAAEKLLGHAWEEARGQVMHELVHSKRLDGSPYPTAECQSFEVLCDGLTRHSIDEVFWHKDGYAVHVDIVAAPIWEDGQITGAVVMFTDTTERKSLLATLNRWQDVFDNAKWGVVVGSADGQTLEQMNPAFAQMHGFTVAELTGRPIADVFAPQARQDLQEHIRRAHDEGHHLWETWHLHKDGSQFPVFLDITAVKDEQGRVLYRVINVQDISARHAAAKTLRESEERYRMLADNSSDMILRLSSNAVVNYVSPACLTLLGLPPNAILGSSAFDFCVLEDQSLARQAFAAAEAGERAFLARLRLRRPDGQITWAEASCQRIEKATQDQTREYIATVRDIGERVAAEAKIVNSEANLARAQAVAQVGSWRYDLSNHHIEWSAETHRIFCVPLGTSVDYPFFLNCIHPQDRDAVDQAWRQALLGARYDIRHRIISAGEVRWVREQAEMVCDACGVVVQVVGTVQDISDWHASQQELLSSRQALRDLAAHNDKLREEERTRIAREIHDHLGQHLTALRMETVLLGAHCCQAHPEMMERVQRMTETIDETIEVVRDVSTALRPACLDLGLVAAADWALAVFQRRTGIQGTLICGHESIDLDDQRATAIFRILQEALNNVARHARATHVQVTLSLQAMDLLLETSDNGIGFDPLSTPLKKTFGIIGMRERALEFGGALTITRRALGGTTLQVLVPLEQGAAA